jgi:hypothetical protein
MIVESGSLGIVVVVEQEDPEEVEVARIGMGDFPQQLLVSEGKG